MKKYIKIAALLVGLVIFLSSYVYINSQNKDENLTSTHQENYSGQYDQEKYEASNYQIIISNQSFERPSVELKAYMDGEFIFFDTYKVEDQHDYSYYYFNLQPGSHELTIESEHGEILKESFIIGDAPHYVYLTYWYDGQEEVFNYSSSHEPIGLD